MSLDALAPDQRAVVQLVLQQERTYEELAGLLGISTEAVRDRAHRGLDRLAPDAPLSDEERGQVADYLLAQQSVSKREATRSLLSSSAGAREWAQTVARQIEDVARGPLPEIPGGSAAAEEPAPRRERPRPTPAPEREPEPEPVTEEPATTEAPAVRARPRPRQRPATTEDRPKPRPTPTPAATSRRDDDGPKRSSKLGGALLIGGLAILLVALVIVLVSSGDDNGGGGGGDTQTDASATPTATATTAFQPLGQIELAQVGGGDAKGQLVIFGSAENTLAFTIQAENMPQSRRGEAYAVWLIGGRQPHRLGFAPAVGADGKFGTSGPRNADAKDFPNWLAEAKQVVVSRETTQDAKQPGPIVLGGDIPSGGAG